MQYFCIFHLNIFLISLRLTAYLEVQILISGQLHFNMPWAFRVPTLVPNDGIFMASWPTYCPVPESYLRASFLRLVLEPAARPQVPGRADSKTHISGQKFDQGVSLGLTFWGSKASRIKQMAEFSWNKINAKTSSNSIGSSGLCCPARRQGYGASICPLTSHHMKAAPGKEKWYINDCQDKQLKYPLPHTLTLYPLNSFPLHNALLLVIVTQTSSSYQLEVCSLWPVSLHPPAAPGNHHSTLHFCEFGFFRFHV